MSFGAWVPRRSASQTLDRSRCEWVNPAPFAAIYDWKAKYGGMEPDATGSLCSRAVSLEFESIGI